MRTKNTQPNPFTPTFGEVPLHVAGREVVLNDLQVAYSTESRHPALTTVITGARGTGKTALLSLAADIATQQGWVVARSVAIPGMLDDILISTRRAAAHLLPTTSKKLKGLEVGQVLGVEWETSEAPTNWRDQMTTVLEQLDQTQTGLLITVDEVQPSLEEMVQLVAIYQLLVTEGRKVALLMAGLPSNILQLETDKTVSFLRRAQKYHLERIPDFEIEDAMLQTVEDSGKTIAKKALSMAVEASGGFPFMMQLVGFRIWNNARAKEITTADAEAGIELARAEMKERILATTYYSLSQGDKNFLTAMVQLPQPWRVPEVAKAMGKTNSYATQYRNRLLNQGVLEDRGDGSLAFALPFMHDYVKDQA